MVSKLQLSSSGVSWPYIALCPMELWVMLQSIMGVKKKKKKLWDGYPPVDRQIDGWTGGYPAGGVRVPPRGGTLPGGSGHPPGGTLPGGYPAGGYPAGGIWVPPGGYPARGLGTPPEGYPAGKRTLPGGSGYPLGGYPAGGYPAGGVWVPPLGGYPAGGMPCRGVGVPTSMVSKLQLSSSGVSWPYIGLMPHGIMGNVAKHHGSKKKKKKIMGWVPLPLWTDRLMDGQTRVKTLPSRRTTYAGGKNNVFFLDFSNRTSMRTVGVKIER